MPKSAIASRPCWSSSMLAGLTSRCTTPAACAASSAEAASRSQRSAVCSEIRSPLRSLSATVPPVSSSITMNVRPSCSPTSKIVTTFGWLESPAAARASRWKRWRARSSSERCEPSSLTATSRPSSSSWASQTLAIPPFAMWRTTR